jgi:hypothetical protein
MSSLNEKDAHAAVHRDGDSDMTKEPVITEDVVGSGALTAALKAHKPALWSKSMIKLYMIVCPTRCLPP